MDEMQPFLALGLARDREPPGRAADWRIREINHRLANSLQLAVDLLGLQYQRSDDPRLRQGLEDAMARLVAVGQLHRHLSAREPQALLELSSFLRGLCPAIEAGTGLTCQLAADPINVSAEMAQNIAILINECAINARKHAYGREGGLLRIVCEVAPGRLSISVADEGRGLRTPPEGAREGLGMGIIQAILREVGGRMGVESRDGARFTFLIPIAAPAGPERSFARWSEP